MIIPPFRRHSADVSPPSGGEGERRRGHSAAVLSPLAAAGLNRLGQPSSGRDHSAAIPPTVDADRRDLYRPDTPDARRPAVLELLGRGLTPRDVAQALRIGLAEVMEAARSTNVPGSSCVANWQDLQRDTATLRARHEE